MKRNQLGRTGIEVSALSLGTMTFGTQTDRPDAFAQMDYALEHGIDFWDTAEMYPVNPLSAGTQGESERILGEWFSNTGRRSEVVLATKHSGNGIKYLRDGADITAESIPVALEGSLRRLQTDVIDLYQFHWPNRGSYMFRQNWDFDPSKQDGAAVKQNMADCLGALQREVDRGTIRAFGLSNDSAWGTANWLRLSEEGHGPRAASVQNEYSLLCRLFDTDMAELSMNEDVGLFCFSPLAAGLLTGKYQDGATPQGSRKDINGTLGGRWTDRVEAATQAYLDIATKHGIDPTHMANAFCMQRPFMVAAIFGATTLGQLKHIVAGKDLILSDEVMKEINLAHRAHPMPY